MPIPLIGGLFAGGAWALFKRVWPYVAVLLVATGIVLYIWFKSKAECEQDHQREQATQTIDRIEEAASNDIKSDEIIQQHQDQIKIRLPNRRAVDPVFILDPYRACLLQAKEPLAPGVCN